MDYENELESMFSRLSIEVTEPLHVKVYNFASEVFRKWSPHPVKIPSPEYIRTLLPPTELSDIIYYALVRLENRARGQELYLPDMPMEIQLRQLLYDSATFHCQAHLNSLNPGRHAARCRVCTWKGSLWKSFRREEVFTQYLFDRFMEDPINIVANATKPQVTPQVSEEDIEEMRSRLYTDALCTWMSQAHF